VDDDRESLIMRQQDELEDDARLVEEYGRSHDDAYGGVSFDNETFPAPVRLVTAFTRDLDGYLAALHSVVPHPERVDVRSCRFSKQECVAMADHVSQLVLAAMPEIRSLAVLPSIWSGTTVLVEADDVEVVQELLRNEPFVTVEEGGYRP